MDDHILKNDDCSSDTNGANIFCEKQDSEQVEIETKKLMFSSIETSGPEPRLNKFGSINNFSDSSIENRNIKNPQENFYDENNTEKSSNLTDNFNCKKYSESISNSLLDYKQNSPGNNQNNSLFDIIKNDVEVIEKKIEKMDVKLVSGHKYKNSLIENERDIIQYKDKMKNEDIEMINKINDDESHNENSLFDIIEKGMNIVETKIGKLDEKFLSQKKNSIADGYNTDYNSEYKTKAQDDLIYVIPPMSLDDNFNEVKNSLKNSLKKSQKELSANLKHINNQYQLPNNSNKK